MERRERAGRDVTADADAGFLPFGWALAVPSHLILCDFMVLALFQIRASGVTVVLKKTASFCRFTVAVSGLATAVA